MGRIIVIIGPMGAGKTSELLRYIERAETAEMPIALYKFSGDLRYSSRFSTHTQRESSLPCTLLDSFEGVEVPKSGLVCVDEAQFISGVVPWAREVARGATCVLSVLSSDAWQKPFPQFGEICASADEIIQLRGICYKCKQDAIYTKRRDSQDAPRIAIGGFDVYQPVCRGCL